MSYHDSGHMKHYKPYIYLVDDDEDDRNLFVEALQTLKLGATIVPFNNGVDLMAALFDETLKLPDLIFLDLNMPLMNGEECLEDIRGESLFSEIPIIIYSSYFEEPILRKLQEMGADHYLQKPRSFELLKKRIERCVHIKGRRSGSTIDYIIE